MLRHRDLLTLGAGATLALSAAAQTPTIEIAFAKDAATAGLPAVSWLCGTVLPLRPEWPAGLSRDDSVVVRLSTDGLTIQANSVALPAGTLAAGSIRDGRDGHNHRALVTCSTDGVEDWFVPREFTPPVRWLRLLQILRATATGSARTIDAPVAVGHLLGATALGDPDLETCQLGASLCGEVTWKSWWNDEHLRVRGRSGGGLVLPAVLLAVAEQRGNGTTTALPMRAFVARDGDREEAVRQMARSTTDRPALLAMLHGSDELRLTAIDSLVRLGAVNELPRIVEAATSGMPLATVAAADAVTTLWPAASSRTRAMTREALDGSTAAALRNLDPERSTRRVGQPTVITRNWQLMLALFIIASGLFGLWLRERARAAMFA